jgi:glycosyltransferase involved in cell wall biosynthesis
MESAWVYVSLSSENTSKLRQQMKYDVTIGIPVYKSVDYVQRSMASALNQTYSSIEFLLIDDGGADGSIEIVERMKADHHRGRDIRIIKHEQNKGVAASRNRIIDEASGEFLYFMDSDDVIAKNTIELLMQHVRQYDAEIAFGSYERIELTGKKTVFQYPAIQLLEEDEMAIFAYRKYAGIQASACNYIVKTSILRNNNLQFISTNYWEDFVFTSDLVTFVSRAVLLPNITYHYICRCNSLSHYQERIGISKEEICQSIKANRHLVRTSDRLRDKVYYPNRCYVVAMTNFYIACAILKRRNAITPFFSNQEIKSIMCHPASWLQICSFHQARLKNMFIYMIGKMPSSVCVAIIWMMGKVKKLI